MNLNSVTISGNLVADASLRSTQAGGSVLSMRVAVNERVKRGESWEDVPIFIDCTLFGSRGASIAEYLKKGTKVSICGRLHKESWNDKDTGQQREKLSVIINDIDIASGGKRNDATSASTAAHAAAKANAYQPDAYCAEDIPF